MDRGTARYKADIYTGEQVREILTLAGVDIANELDADYLVFCPYHNNYRTPAGEVSKTTGRFYCFSCGETQPLEALLTKSGMTYFQALRAIDVLKSEEDIISSIDNIISDEPEFIAYDEEQIAMLHKQALKSERAINYYKGRSITRESVEKFMLGYSSKQDMVIIPVKDPSGSIFLGFVGRSIEGKTFKNSTGLPKSKTFFNLCNAKRHEEVYVVESSFDAIRLDQNGIAAIATLGANISKTQLGLLTKYFNNAIVVGDNDEAGKEMQNKVIKHLRGRATLVNIPSRFKDIGDMTDEDIQKLNTKISDPLLSIL